MAKCQKIRPAGTYTGKQGFDYAEGVSRETAGAKGICLHLLTIPPGGRAKAHMHAGHETALYALAGTTVMWWGERLENRMEVGPGEMVYIPAGMPHLPANLTGAEARVLVARTDPHEQESVVLLPELDALVPN